MTMFTQPSLQPRTGGLVRAREGTICEETVQLTSIRRAYKGMSTLIPVFLAMKDVSTHKSTRAEGLAPTLTNSKTDFFSSVQRYKTCLQRTALWRRCPHSANRFAPWRHGPGNCFYLNPLFSRGSAAPPPNPSSKERDHHESQSLTRQAQAAPDQRPAEACCA